MKMLAANATSTKRPIGYRAQAVAGLLVLAGLAATLSACKTTDPGTYQATDASADFQLVTNAAPPNIFTREKRTQLQGYANKDSVKAFSSQTEKTYRLGPGDAFEFMVRGREDISVKNVIVSPDGQIALPRVGILDVEGQSMATVTSNITARLHQFYEEPEVTLVMTRYNNNKVYVLGRVANPGVVNFHGTGNLLEALSLAGGLPVDTTRSWLSRCMIVRGNDVIIWIDLRDLLDNGNMTLNAQLRNGDVIYIPQSMDQVAYVMGEVKNPGVLQLSATMTVLDAIMYQGGATDDATTDQIYLVRATGDKAGAVEEINLKKIYKEADFRKNYVLNDGDIVFVPKNGITKYNYYINQLLPTLSVLDFSINAVESFGVLDQYRTVPLSR